MPDTATCAKCGALLTSDASACPSCGKLTAPQTVSPLEVVGSLVVGFVLAFVYGLLLLGSAQGCASPTSVRGLVGIALSIAGIVGALGALAHGIRLATAGKARRGANLIAGAFGFLVPTAPCAVSILVAVGSTPRC